MLVEIDKNSGYCFGVEYAIQMAEDGLEQNQTLYCLGDIVHNDMEVRRLADKGLIVVDREKLHELHDCKVLIRAHGEPPETYSLALKHNIELIDASCPVVLKLQNRIKHEFDRIEKRGGQVVIYGQHGHAEVAGLAGQTEGRAIIVKDESDLKQVDFTRPIALFSQTTKSTAGFYHMHSLIENEIASANETVEPDFFDSNDSICRQVSNREPQLRQFAQNFEVVIFVSGKKSSNGKALYGVCQAVNPNSYFVENDEDLDFSWFENKSSVGICGATSTPSWLMEQIARAINLGCNAVSNS